MRSLAISSLVIALSLGGAAPEASRADEGDAAFHKRDFKTALHLLMPLAQQGDAVAELDIGLMYFSGHGLPRDRAQAAKWFLASARQGQRGAQVDIGIAYATGEGIPRDLVQAFMWFSVAADDGGSSATKYRDHVASELTPDEIDRATEYAKVCKVSHFQSCGSP